MYFFLSVLKIYSAKVLNSDSFVKNRDMNPHALAIFCTLKSYEAILIVKRGKFIRKTRAKILCGLREMSKVIPESVCSSIYFARHI